MNIKVQLPKEGENTSSTIDLLREAVRKFCVRCGNYTDILEVTEHGAILPCSFSNEQMLEPVIMLMLLCKEYSQVFSFGFHDNNKPMPRFTAEPTKDSTVWRIQYPSQKGVTSFHVTAQTEVEALVNAEEREKNTKNLPTVGFWVRRGQLERAIQILEQSSMKIEM